MMAVAENRHGESMVPVILDFSQACYIKIILSSASAFSTPLWRWPVYRPTKNNRQEQSFNMAEEKSWCRTKIESRLTKWNWEQQPAAVRRESCSCGERGLWSKWFIALYQFCFSWRCLHLLRSRNCWPSMIHHHHPLLEWITRPVEQKRKWRNHTQRKRCLLCSWSLMRSLPDSIRKSKHTHEKKWDKYSYEKCTDRWVTPNNINQKCFCRICGKKAIVWLGPLQGQVHH